MKKASCFQVKYGKKYFSSGDENISTYLCASKMSLSVTYEAKHIKYYDWFMQYLHQKQLNNLNKRPKCKPVLFLNNNRLSSAAVKYRLIDDLSFKLIC